MPTQRHRTARCLALAICALGVTLAAAAGEDARVVSKTEPEFPHEALRAGADEGKVRARVTVDGSGEVTRVEILEAIPRRLFDRAVIRTLSQWKFNAGADGRLVEVDVNFHR